MESRNNITIKVRRAVLGILKRTFLLDRANGVAVKKLAGAAQFGT